MTRRIITAALAALLALSMFGAAFANGHAPQGPPKRVFVCHFEGHDAPDAWSGGGEMLDGDYVLEYREEEPTVAQIDYCLDNGGEKVITISERALDGHGAQLQERVDDYPDR